MKTPYALPVAALLALAAQPAAAEAFRGFYFGVHGGSSTQTDDTREFLRFDTDGDGQFADLPKSPTNPSLFRAFCGGGPNGGYVQAGCRNDFDDKAGDTGFRLGYDWQSLDLVYGIVAEHSSGGVTDNVTGFTTTLDTYTFNRELGAITSLRGRLGFTFGDGTNLLYGTAGYAWSSVDHVFTPTNALNTFSPTSAEVDAKGVVLGVGFETFVWKNFTVGLEYLSHRFSDDGFTVRASGPGPAVDACPGEDPDGTDIRRSSRDIDVGSTRLTFNARFPGW